MRKCTVGKMEITHPTQNLEMSAFRDIMRINLEGNFRNIGPNSKKIKPLY
jgi:hypothetical protein